MLPAVLFNVFETSLYSSRRWKGCKMALIGERHILKIDSLFISEGKKVEESGWNHTEEGGFIFSEFGNIQAGLIEGI